MFGGRNKTLEPRSSKSMWGHGGNKCQGNADLYVVLNFETTD